jgi:alpha-glucosidase
MVFEFSAIRLGNGNLFSGKYIYEPFALSTLKKMTAKWQTFMEGTDGWATVFCENHDNGRAVSHFGDTSTRELWARSAKTIALWQTTMSGTLFLYQGQEIGMTNMPASWDMDEYKDIEARNFYAEAVASGDQDRIAKTRHGLGILARDHSRIPFQWSDGVPNAGFSPSTSSSNKKAAATTVPTTTTTMPWMRVHDGYREINAAKQMGDPTSVLSFYKHELRLRKTYKDLFVFGTHTLLDADNEAV